MKIQLKDLMACITLPPVFGAGAIFDKYVFNKYYDGNPFQIFSRFQSNEDMHSLFYRYWNGVDKICSNNHQDSKWQTCNGFTLVLQGDGNLVLYTSDWKPIWASDDSRIIETVFSGEICCAVPNCYNAGFAMNTNNYIRRYDTKPEVINLSPYNSDSYQHFNRMRTTVISATLRNQTTKGCLHSQYGVNSKTHVSTSYDSNNIDLAWCVTNPNYGWEFVDSPGIGSKNDVWTPCDSSNIDIALFAINLNEVLNIPFEQQSKYQSSRQDCSSLVNRYRHVIQSLNRAYQIGMSRLEDFNISLVNAIIYRRSQLGVVVARMILYRSEFAYDLVYSETAVTE
jgi:hypothetical protein